MEAVGGTIESDVSGHRPGGETLFEPGAVGDLVYEAALFGGGEERGQGFGHRRLGVL